MKALTLHQPHAHLVGLGAKVYETRSWPTKFRGLTTEADGLHDMSLTEARLYEDIAEFGERELKPFELRIGSQMLARYRTLKRKARP